MIRINIKTVYHLLFVVYLSIYLCILGTYNNQYMVIDLKQIQLEQSVNDGALWIVEQLPGYTEGHDQTPILRTGEIYVIL